MQATFVNQLNAKIESWILHPKYSIVRHLLFIILLASDFHIFNFDVVRFFVKHAGVTPTVAYIFLLSKATMAILCSYWFLLYLNPKYLYTGKYAAYTLGVVLFLIGFWLLYLALFEVFVPNLQEDSKTDGFDFITPIHLLGPLIFLGAVTGYRFYKTLLLEKERFAELEKEKFAAELTQLKNQVNPHFLFNTLNNLHVLIKTNPTHAAQIVLGLSDLLRYQTYESASEKVLLTRDIAAIEDYISIEKLRRDHFEYRIHTLGEMSSILVPPLIFIVFVENALKHSLDVRQSTSMELFFSYENAQLQFHISNSKPQKQTIVEKGGVGLINVRKRLDLMYGENYKLDIQEDTDQFHVTLKIPI